MRDLNRWLTGFGVVVEGQQAVLTEAVQDRLQRMARKLERRQFRIAGAPPGIFCAFAGRNQPQENMLSHGLLLGIQTVVYVFSPACQCPDYPAALLVGSQGEPVPGALFKYLGE